VANRCDLATDRTRSHPNGESNSCRNQISKSINPYAHANQHADSYSNCDRNPKSHGDANPYACSYSISNGYTNCNHNPYNDGHANSVTNANAYATRPWPWSWQVYEGIMISGSTWTWRGRKTVVAFWVPNASSDVFVCENPFFH
jgi:hypothetical protein